METIKSWCEEQIKKLGIQQGREEIIKEVTGTHNNNICCQGCYRLGIIEGKRQSKVWCTECNGEDKASICKWCYEDTKKSQFKGDLLKKSNHILGCMLECFCNILDVRGFNKEAIQLGEIASKIK